MDESIASHGARLREVSTRFGERLGLAVDSFLACLSLQNSVASELSQLDSASSSPETMTKVLSPLAQKVELVVEMRDGVHRKDVLEYHLLALGEATSMLAWLVADNPVSVCSNAEDRVAAALAKVRTKGENGDPAHAQFADAVQGLVSATKTHVERNHPTGVNSSLSASFANASLGPVS